MSLAPEELQQILEHVKDGLKQGFLELKDSAPRPHPAEPAALSYMAAAERLDIGITKLKIMVRDGEIAAITLGRRKLIPMSEIKRITTPAPVKAHRGKRHKSSSHNPDVEAARIRELTKDDK